MTDPVLVPLHSPLVGPLTWQPVAACLRRAGHTVLTPDLTPAATGTPPHQPAVAEAVAGSLVDLGGDAPVVLVGHSGAGPLLPGVAQAVPREAHALLYVDSALPCPGQSWWENAPPPLVEQLRGLVTDGKLPPWHEWFPPEAVTELLPDPRLRADFVRELPRLPYTYLTERTVPQEWTGRAGYLLLSEGYRPDARAALRAGLPVVERSAHHLAMLTAPQLVSDALADLLTETR
ncbi:alpha/beta fold hydrolase [Micromonospora sp. WMMA1923]|uniref:alpha/beta fold hydrolase n=1 Tax=Micromonospora sp. WMMA1923 TaxID=3404125 RepID=UPI003B92C99C